LPRHHSLDRGTSSEVFCSWGWLQEPWNDFDYTILICRRPAFSSKVNTSLSARPMRAGSTAGLTSAPRFAPAFANEQRHQIGQPEVIGPAVCIDLDMVRSGSPRNKPRVGAILACLKPPHSPVQIRFVTVPNNGPRS
jgi:hypothetical protein